MNQNASATSPDQRMVLSCQACEPMLVTVLSREPDDCPQCGQPVFLIETESGHRFDACSPMLRPLN